MKKAVIMCRVSSDEQAKGYSLDVQLESLTRHCIREDIEIVKNYPNKMDNFYSEFE